MIIFGMLILIQASCISVMIDINVNKVYNLNKKKMSKTVKLDNSDIEQTNEELTEVIEIKDSVFSLVRVEDKYFLALGKYRLSEPSTDRALVEASVNDTTWERLMSVMHIVATEAYIEIEKSKEKDVLKGKKK